MELYRESLGEYSGKEVILVLQNQDYKYIKISS